MEKLQISFNWYGVVWFRNQPFMSPMENIRGYVIVYCSLNTLNKMTIIGKTTRIFFKPDSTKEWMSLALTSEKNVLTAIEGVEKIEGRTIPKPIQNNIVSKTIMLSENKLTKGYFIFPANSFENFLEEFRASNCEFRFEFKDSEGQEVICRIRPSNLQSLHDVKKVF